MTYVLVFQWYRDHFPSQYLNSNLNNVSIIRNSDLSNVINWFKINSLKTNLGKFQLMVLVANKNECFNLNEAGKVIPFSSTVKLLGMTIVYELKFKKKY